MRNQKQWPAPEDYTREISIPRAKLSRRSQSFRNVTPNEILSHPSPVRLAPLNEMSGGKFSSNGVQLQRSQSVRPQQQQLSRFNSTQESYIPEPINKKEIRNSNQVGNQSFLLSSYDPNRPQPSKQVTAPIPLFGSRITAVNTSRLNTSISPTPTPPPLNKRQTHFDEDQVDRNNNEDNYDGNTFAKEIGVDMAKNLISGGDAFGDLEGGLSSKAGGMLGAKLGKKLGNEQLGEMIGDELGEQLGGLAQDLAQDAAMDALGEMGVEIPEMEMPELAMPEMEMPDASKLCKGCSIV